MTQIEKGGRIHDSPFIFGLGVPGINLTVFSCDLDPAAEEDKHVTKME